MRVANHALPGRSHGLPPRPNVALATVRPDAEDQMSVNHPATAPTPYDVIVVGGGNAALNAAMAARHHVERVLLLERAPRWIRGGNSRHTRDIRAAHDGIDRVTTGKYPEEELLDDLVRIGGGRENMDLARLIVRELKTLFEWMIEQRDRLHVVL